MKISVITPTYDRPEWHENLYGVFCSQDWPDKELVVVDDSAEPSPFFSALADDRVIYRHARTRLPIGPKRNLLTKLARGEVIAHFDDDDYYAPDYLTWMHGELAQHDAVKAGGFFILSLLHDSFAYWDVVEQAPHHYKMGPKEPLSLIPVKDYSATARESFRTNFLYGLGFSFMYRKAVTEKVGFGDKHWGEDHDFLKAADEAGMAVRVVHDRVGHLCCLRHGEGSTLFPQYLIPAFLFAELFGAAGVAYVERVKLLLAAKKT